jgi:hypothetical protein
MMNVIRPLALFAVLCAGLSAAARGQPGVPLPPAPPVLPAPHEPSADARREYWRSLTPEQRESIRRLSQEQRQALINRAPVRPGEAPAPAGRLSLEERRQLRAQIREEHERRGPRMGGAKRP